MRLPCKQDPSLLSLALHPGRQFLLARPHLLKIAQSSNTPAPDGDQLFKRELVGAIWHSRPYTWHRGWLPGWLFFLSGFTSLGHLCTHLQDFLLWVSLFWTDYPLLSTTSFFCLSFCSTYTVRYVTHHTYRPGDKGGSPRYLPILLLSPGLCWHYTLTFVISRDGVKCRSFLLYLELHPAVGCALCLYRLCLHGLSPGCYFSTLFILTWLDTSDWL